MLFNSIDFAVFLPIVFIIYWFLTNKSLKLQNLLIVIASYVFYGWWDWRFLSLILFSTILDYTIGRFLSKEEDEYKRKRLLWFSVIVNLGFLGLFKYYNFFLENFIAAFSLFGTKLTAPSLSIILPVGISFYTFQTLSYTIDVYKRKLEPSADFVQFCAFVSFFPQLVAGPIERATHLLPQFSKARVFNYSNAVDGMRQILWGLFKKIVVADNCAQYANLIFSNSSEYNGSTLVLGALFFTFQIYGDFSGYSDIAIGTSKLFGFNLMQNFNFPYFSRDMAEFWRRWHISLSTWFRDYLYIPLGGSHGSTLMKVRNTFVIFIVSGFWHGANWTFVIWGALNALFFLPVFLSKGNQHRAREVSQGWQSLRFRELIAILATFGLTVFAWIFFRANTVNHAISYIRGIFSLSLFDVPVFPNRQGALTTIILLCVFVLIEWFGRDGKYAIENISKIPVKKFRVAYYYALIVTILLFGNFSENTFIYFQF